VRPEAAVIGRSAGELGVDAAQAVHAGDVESLLFDGANSAVLVREQKTRLEFRIALPQTGRYADLRVGERIVFSFDATRAACFPAPAAHA
jgi:spermidine/putrescine transport system ATP-binding protein